MNYTTDDIQSREDWWEVWRDAKDQAEQIVRLDPSFAVGTTILEKLRFMEQCVSDGRMPTDFEKESVKLGIFAVRNLDESDPRFSSLLKQLNYTFKHWEGLPKDSPSDVSDKG